MAGFSITDFATLPTDFSLLGTAVVNINNGSDASKVLRLVASTQGFDTGAILYDKKVGLKAFTCTIKFRITSGADGIYLVFHNDPPIVDATFPARMLGGKTPSVIFEVDTFYNSESGDPNDSHIGINLNGSLMSEKTAAVATKLDNNNLRTMLIEYANNHVDVSIDGSVLLQHDIDLSSSLSGTDSYVFIEGFTGGGTSNHDIIEWSLDYTSFPVISNALMFSCNT